ncbi:Barwin-related endoglucanase [Gossypium australe]|uniref:Barwin-related endoglucanase n=1 Tax=Gossypium australe TaxID=47621 RepID=A0A5B6UVX8_9ROSI|nr:Barwin-related endoglucanase [Gossypium australe]
MVNYSLFFVVMVACLISFASATPRIATFYTKYVPSACFGNQDHGKMITAAGDALWDNGTVCGKMFTVTCTGPRNPVPHPCTGKSVTVKIIDHCPGCPSTIDLSQEAFTIIANPVAGIINVDYKQYA